MEVEFAPGLLFDVHAAASCARDSPILVFVHGGAWHSDDKAHHRDFAARLAALARCPVLVPNYRLTTKENGLKHPAHAQDVLAFLTFITTVWPGVPDVLDPAARPLCLMGHSAGAHMLASIFLDSGDQLTPSPAVLARVRAIVMSEGIYDLDLLLATFPAYRDWFIASAFADRPSYRDVSTTTLALRPNTDLRWLLIHSDADTLVDRPQSQNMYDHLCALYGSDATERVQCNFDELDVDHDDVTKPEPFFKVIGAFVDGLRP